MRPLFRRFRLFPHEVRPPAVDDMRLDPAIPDALHRKIRDALRLIQRSARGRDLLAPVANASYTVVESDGRYASVNLEQRILRICDLPTMTATAYVIAHELCHVEQQNQQGAPWLLDDDSFLDVALMEADADATAAVVLRQAGCSLADLKQANGQLIVLPDGNTWPLPLDGRRRNATDMAVYEAAFLAWTAQKQRVCAYRRWFCDWTGQKPSDITCSPPDDLVGHHWRLTDRTLARPTLDAFILAVNSTLGHTGPAVSQAA